MYSYHVTFTHDRVSSPPGGTRPTRDPENKKRTIDLATLADRQEMVTTGAFCVYDHDHTRQILQTKRDAGLGGHAKEGGVWVGCTIILMILR